MRPRASSRVYSVSRTKLSLAQRICPPRSERITALRSPRAKAAICALTISIAREMGKYGVTSNFIAPRARTRMTQSMPNSSMFDAPENGFDAFHPAWPAQLVVFLASEQAADVNGQGFIVWGGEVQLVSGWHKVGGVESPGSALAARDLIARKDELFGSQPRQPTYM